MPSAPMAAGEAPDAGNAEAPPEAPVLLIPGAPAPEPAVAPSVRILSPSSGQVVAAAKVNAVAIKLDTKNWPVSPTAGRVHLLIDGKPARTVNDLKAPLTLGDLAGTVPFGDGQHILLAVLARGEGESIKSKDALASAEFFVGKASKGAIDLKRPYLIVAKPDGAYEDATAEHVLIDFLAIGSNLGDGKDKVALRVEGPGIQEALTATTTRAIPYYLENLHAGTYSLKVELQGPDGKPIDTPWATMSRTMTVKRTAGPHMPRHASTSDFVDAGAPDAAARVDLRDAGAADASAVRDNKPLKEKPVVGKPKPVPPVVPPPKKK